MTKIPFTPEKYKELKKRGLTDEKIARIIGCSRSKLLRWKKKKLSIVNVRASLDEKGLTPEKYKEMKRAGMKDSEIVEKMKCSYRTLIRWKRDNGLSPSQWNKTKELTIDQYNEYRKQGLLDREIAEKLGVTGSAIGTWKIRNGIPVTPFKNINEKLTVDEYLEWKNQGILDTEISKKLKVSPVSLTKWKKENGLNVRLKQGGTKKKKLNITKKEYEEYKNEGLTDDEMAECIYEVSPYYFKERLKALGIKTRRPKPRNFTVEEYEELKRQGKKEYEIMEIFGFKVGATYRLYKKRLGIEMRSKFFVERDQELINKIFDLRRKGLTHEEIGKEVGVSRMTVLAITYEEEGKKRQKKSKGEAS